MKSQSHIFSYEGIIKSIHGDSDNGLEPSSALYIVTTERSGLVSFNYLIPCDTTASIVFLLLLTWVKGMPD